MSDLRSLPVGTLLSDYRFERVLGHGGFGITYLATDIALDQQVAIKEYYPREFAVRDSTKTVHATGSADDRDNFSWGLERFREEAKTLARFSHPNVISVRRLFEANGTSYIVMDFCDGEPLDALIKRDAPLPAKVLENLFRAILDALEHVHAAGIMHRDIKPANIFMRADGDPVLLDFGAARQALVNHSRSMTSLATAHYAAFEQYSTSGNQGPWTDIYGLSATLYHAATGEKPQDAPDRILEDKLVPLATKAGGRYEPNLLNAIDAGLAVRPQSRPQSVTQWRKSFNPECAARTSTASSGKVGGSDNQFKDPGVISNKSRENAFLGSVAAFFAVLALVFVFVVIYSGDFATPSADASVTPYASEEPLNPEAKKAWRAQAKARAAAEEAKAAAAAAQLGTGSEKAYSTPCPDDLEVTWDRCFGSFEFDNGMRYVGNWKNNQLSGPGIYYWADGDRYEGKSKNGERTKGTYYWSDGERYEGDFVNSKMSGFGIYYFSDGTRYEGEWRNDNKDGYGVEISIDGSASFGYYKDGNLVTAIATS